MSADKNLDELLDSVADGDEIDWAALEAHADPEILALLAHLKTIAGVADVHRTSTDEDATGPVPVPASMAGTGLGELGRWGHLQLVRKVGEGSYGEVYHARDTWLDHPVALKLLRAELSDRVAPTKLLDEARVLVKVRHPNVVAVHGADLQQNRVGFWMEFVQGQRLDDVVAFQGLLSAEEAAEIGQQLCAALAAVHDAGLVHRDVKAQNVIRDPKGRVVLMDFGAGQLMADVVGGGGAGTPLYLAPEMFNDAPASVQTDIYALGVLLYYLVTAGYPVPARSIEELKEAHARGRQRPLLVARPGLPRGFVNVVEKMLKVDPAERYQTANEALAGFKRFTAPASIVRRFAAWTGYLAIGVVVVTVLGLLNTVAFNVVMNRSSAFHQEWTLTTWFNWGLSSLLAPAVYIAVGALGLSVLVGLVRIACRSSHKLQHVMGALSTWCVDMASQRGLDTPTLALQLAVASGAIALAVLFWSFWDYGAGFLFTPPFISDAPMRRLAALRPGNELGADAYGLLIDGILLAYLIAYTRITTWARRINSPVPRATRMTAALLPVMALLMWQLPFRVVYQNTSERVDLANVRCYKLGENESSLLLHCPDVAPPRNRVVDRSNPALRFRGVVESIFVEANQSHPQQ